MSLPISSTHALEVSYDEFNDVLTIDGQRYAGGLFRALSLASPGTWLRIEEREREVLHVYSVEEKLEKIFDDMAGRGLRVSKADSTRAARGKR